MSIDSDTEQRKRSKQRPTRSQQTPRQSYFEVPNRLTRSFVGREDILARIDETFSSRPGPCIAVLQGMGGQGKSQVALEYCRRKRDGPYSAIFWVDATTEGTVIGSFQTIYEHIEAGKHHLPNAKSKVDFVLHAFASWPTSWLMIFDNYDDPNAFSNLLDFVPRGEHGAILVTSRYADFQALFIECSGSFIELPGLEEDAALDLLKKHSQTKDSSSDDARTIVRRLVCHPLAITQAGAYIRKQGIRLSDFMIHYNGRRENILKNTPQFSQYRKKLNNTEEETSLNVFTTWELSFRQLQSQPNSNGNETKLLTLFAFFDEKDISEQFFTEYEFEDMPAELANLSEWLKGFCDADHHWDHYGFRNALIELRDLSLIQSFTEVVGFCHSSLHPLIKDWIQLRTEIPTSQENCLVVAMLLKRFLLNSHNNGHFDLAPSANQVILAHLIAQEENYENHFVCQSKPPVNQKTFLEHLFGAQCRFAAFFSEKGSYDNAAKIYQRAKTHYEKALGPEHPVTRVSMNNLALAYQSQGRWDEAEKLQVQVLEMKTRLLGAEHADTLGIMNNLASTYQYQKRWKEAEELGVQVLEVSKKILGAEHPDTLVSMNNLVLTYLHQVRLDKAEELQLQVVETNKRLLRTENPGAMTDMHNLACIYDSLDREFMAIALMTVAVQWREKNLGADHPDTKESTGFLRRWKGEVDGGEEDEREEDEYEGEEDEEEEDQGEEDEGEEDEGEEVDD
ncbi:MAG: hypothetical protein Q9187_004722 [Circinaria calcarea]